MAAAEFTEISVRPRGTEGTCELVVDGQPGSILVTEAVEAGASVEDLDRLAESQGPADRVEVPGLGSAAAWIPPSSTASGTLWVLSDGRLVQFSAYSIDNVETVAAVAAVALAAKEAGE